MTKSAQFDDGEVMLDDDHGVTVPDEGIKGVHQDLDVVGVKTGSGFVEDEERTLCFRLGGRRQA